MAELQLRGLRKQYGDADAVVRGVDLTVLDGEFMVLVGPSGCGKSTTLRMIAGLETPSDGQIHIGPREVTDLPPAERSVAMVFQSYALYPHMTVAQNMGFGLKMAGVNARDAEQRVQRAARSLQLDKLLARRPRELSGGQRQRVAIGRAIVREPAVFLFDEPLSNLDAALRHQMRAELAELHQRLGATVVYVTHDQVEAMTLGQRIAVFHQGRIEQVGPPLTLYQRPATRFVAGFLGAPQMNFLPAWVARELQLAAPEGAVELGIRPEHLRWAPFQPSPVAPGVAVQLERAEHLGDLALLHTRLAGHDAPVVLKTGLAPQALPQAPADLWLQADPAHVIFFDADGRALYGDGA